MKQAGSAFRSIAHLMLQRIVALAVVCFIGISSVQIWWERSYQGRQFLETMALIVEASSRSMAHALWDIEREQLQQQLQRLAELESVGFVRVQVHTTGEVFEAGRKSPDEDVPSYETLIMAPNSSEQTLGTVKVWADASYHRALLWNSQKHVIPGYLLFTVLLCLMVAVVMRRDLGLPLRQIADFAAELKPQDLNQPLHLQRPQRNQHDEIDLVKQGFEHLQHALDRHIKDLDGLVQERTLELRTMMAEIERLSQIDTLTGALNRRGMESRLHLEIERCTRYARPLSVIFTDIDHFKRINDQHGHSVGDAVLRAVAQAMQGHLRSQVDWMVRFGGEEFVIFMPETDIAHAAEAAERLADMVRSQCWSAGGVQLQLTCSFGVAQYQEGEAVDALLARADARLYDAKRSGRNRVCTASV
jgi:two-component system, cell cycle response regulator